MSISILSYLIANLQRRLYFCKMVYHKMSMINAFKERNRRYFYCHNDNVIAAITMTLHELMINLATMSEIYSWEINILSKQLLVKRNHEIL